MKKKILSLLMIGALAVSLLAGCGGRGGNAGNGAQDQQQGQVSAPEEQASAPEEQNSAPGEQASAPEEQPSGGEESGNVNTGGSVGTESMEGKKVGFTVQSLGNDFIVAITEGVKAALAEKGVECQVDSADGDVTKQIEQIENYATMGMDMIIVFPINGEGLTATCQKVMEGGTPVFAFAMEIPDGATTQMLSAEEKDMGAMCAQMASDWIDKTFPDAGDGEVNVYMMSSSNSPEAVERCDAQRTLADINSKVNLIEEETEDWNDQSKARTRMENAFLTNPDIDVVIACNGTSAKGIESYVDSPDSPVQDISKFGIFCVDEDEEIDAKIAASANNESALRGTVSMGSIQDTVNDFMNASEPILTGGTPYPVWNGSSFAVTAESLAQAE